MRKKLLGLLLTVAMIIVAFAAMGTIAYAGEEAVTVNTADDLKNYLTIDTANREILLGADITVDEDLRIKNSSMTLDLNGHNLTMNGKIFLTDGAPGLEIEGKGSVKAGNGTLFVVGSTIQDANPRLVITGGTFTSNGDEPLIMVTGTKEGAKADEGLVINGGYFIANGTGSIIKVDDESPDNMITITDGEFKAGINCIYSSFGANMLISGGSFYSEKNDAIKVTDSSTAFIAAGVSSYVDGEQYTKQADNKKKSITYTKLGDNKLVQIGKDAAFTDVKVSVYPYDTVNYGTVPAGPTRALIGKDFYIKAECADGYKFVGWAKDDNFHEEELISTDANYVMIIPDSPTVNFFPLFAENHEITKVVLGKVGYYNGQTQKPATIQVFSGNTDITEKTDEYTVHYMASDEDSIEPGTYQVNVVGNNKNYTGVVAANYTIAVKPTSFKSLKAGKKSFTVKVAKQPAVNVSGYELRYSLKSNMNGAKRVTIGTKNTAVSKTVKKLKSKKKYYVQVRSYVNVDGQKVYSGWTAVKSAKTK